MLLRYAFISTVSIVSANSYTKTGPPWLRFHRCVSARQGNPTNILETETITFFDGDSSFITASNSERHGFFLCVSGGDESCLKEEEGSSEGDVDASDDDDDNDDDDSGDDGANKMLSNTSVRRCRIAAVQCKNTMACPASSSILVFRSQPVADGAKMINNHLAIPPERCRKHRVSSFPSIAETLLTTRGGESAAAPSSATMDNEFSRRLVVAALVTLLYEAIIGHLLEFLKIVMQTSPPGTSYTQVGRYFYFQLTTSVVSEFSFSSCCTIGLFFNSFPFRFLAKSLVEQKVL